MSINVYDYICILYVWALPASPALKMMTERINMNHAWPPSYFFQFPQKKREQQAYIRTALKLLGCTRSDK